MSKRQDDQKPIPKPVPLSQVAPAALGHLAAPYLPLGAITLLEGDPGSGKSYVTADLAAAVTRGLPPEFAQERQRAKPRNVLIITTEDSPEQLRERFEAQGADLDRVLCLNEPISIKPFDTLKALIQENKPGLVVVDPLHALLEGVSLNSANSVRTALAPLMALAARLRICIVGIRHLAKAGGGRAIYRGLGSIDFSAIARSMLRIGEDPERPGSRVLLQVKNSYGPLGPSIEFEIGAKLIWLGRSELTAADLEARPKRGRGRSAVEIAQEFLVEALSAGPRGAKEIKVEAERAKISERTLERAQKALGVVHLRVSEGGGGRGSWRWSLPPAGAGPDIRLDEA